ncbi:MAG: peptidoglycan DD-metalloendopeptidase family protein [Clostridia bacterium]|nr:peptidoglycan DD-metalloendopeptidase family protein [Clostridia bacterium]
MLSADSYALPRKKNGRSVRRRWVKLRLHTKRLANIGANAVELQGLFGHLARLLSWTGWLLLLWNLLTRTVRKLVTPVSDAMEKALSRFHPGDRLRHQFHEYHNHLKSLGHRRQAGRGAGMALLCSATIMIISSCCFGLGFEVRMDGESLGFVESPSQVMELVERVESRIADYLNAPYSLDTQFSYTMRYMDRTDLLNEELLEQRLFASVDDHSRRYVLSVDGETIGASESKTALELMLRRILLTAADNATEVHTTFANQVTITETTSDTVATTPITEMEAKLTANKVETKTYTVKSGDTVSAIGKAYGMKVSEIEALNPGLDPAKIQIGQELTLSGPVPYLSVQQTVTESYVEPIPYETLIEYDDTMYKNKSKIKVQGVNGTADVVADVTYVNGEETAREVLSYNVTAEPVSAVKIVGTKALPRYMATGSFIKPSNGRYSSGYGYRPNLGDFHTGVDFAGATGTNIWAADGGVVIHAGWKGNYGYCVIIDHQNGYTTYYAHCSKLLVKRGDKVAKGDIIAKVGNTGRSYGSHVHFEIRKNGKTQNPLNYISR